MVKIMNNKELKKMKFQNKAYYHELVNRSKAETPKDKDDIMAFYSVARTIERREKKGETRYAI